MVISPLLDENLFIIFIKKALPRFDGVSSSDLYTSLDVFRRPPTPPPPPPNNLRDGEDGTGAGAGSDDGDGDGFLEDDTDMEDADDGDNGNIVGSCSPDEEETEVGEGNMVEAAVANDGKSSVSSIPCPCSM